MHDVDSILLELKKLADPDKVAYKQAKFGVIANNSLGVFLKDLKELAKQIPKSDELAIALFDTGVYEGRLLCSKLFNPKNLTEELAESWIVTFENWEMCDSFSMGVFARSSLAIPKIMEWSMRKPEFEKRAAFATMAAYCMADKTADNEVFEAFLPIIERESNDNRLYVKKAVNWALRNIGKRNTDLNQYAIDCARSIRSQNTKSALWIASDALKELQKEGVRMSDYPRAIYRKA